MDRNKLLLLPFFVGIVLLVCSWYSSYPISINSSDDLAFNHLSVLYWFSLPLLLSSMCIMAMTSKSTWVKWMMSIGVVMVLYSSSYFFYTLPTSDSNYFRGLNEYFINTKNLNPSQPNHVYFQWPSFFILSNIATSVSGLGLLSFEFLLYSVFGFLLCTTLFVYATKAHKNSGFLAVICLFISVFYFLNFQDVPFTLAFVLLLTLFILETRQKGFGEILTMVILFTGVSLTHAFVPLFFVLYLLFRAILNKSGQYGKLFLTTLTIYFLVQLTQAQVSFATNILTVMRRPSEYGNIVSATLTTPVSLPIDIIAQTLTIITTIIIIMTCFAGFVLLLNKRKLRDLDKAIFLMGTAYSGAGLILYTLGSRAIPLVLIPVALGAAYLFETRFRPYLKFFFLIVVVLIAFIPLHTSFSYWPITFQTKEAYGTAHFMIEKYNWDTYSTILLDVGVKWYINPQVEGNSTLDTDPGFNGSNLGTYDCILYSTGLARALQMNNVSLGETSRQLEGFSIIYNSGFSYIAKKSR